MKKMLAFVCSTVALFCTEMSYAMPSQAELDNVQPLVNELMGPLVKDFKAKKKLAVEVGDGAVELVAESNSDAAKFVLLKGAVYYYTRAKAYDKAADAIESIMELVPDIPPKALYEITSKAAASATVKNAPRLVALNKSAQKRAAVASRLASVKTQLRKTPADLKLIRQHAELLAAMGKWDTALAEFAKLGGEIGQMATADAEAMGEGAELADFWWSYTPTAPEAKEAIREHAASLYQKAIDHGGLDGLKLTLAERRIAEISESNPQAVASKIEYKFNYRLNDKGEAFLCCPKRDVPCVSPKPEGPLVIPAEIDGHKVVGLDDAAFTGCDKMTRVMLPKHLREHGWYWGCEYPGGAFHFCRSLSRIDVAKDNPNFTSVDGVWYTKDKKTLLAYPKTRSEIKLVRECHFILGGAFDSCCFVSAKVPEGIDAMHYWVFINCSDLETIDFPKSFTNWIGAYCFGNCPKLRTVRFHGDAPTAYVRRNSGRNNCMSWAPDGLVIEVKKGTKGWNGKGSTDLPERWPLDGSDTRPIRYIQ